MLEVFAALLLKMIAGGLFNSFFAGTVAGVVEAVIRGPAEEDPAPIYDTTNPDATLTVGAAVTIKPVGVTVPNTGAGSCSSGRCSSRPWPVSIDDR